MKNRSKHILWIFSILLLNPSVNAQSSLDPLLEDISKNNLSIKAYSQLLEAKKLELKTGLYLENPTFEYDYMTGTPANAGNQTDITAVQSFDFPTAYGKKKQLSNAGTEQLEIMLKAHRQDILLESKTLFMELVFLNKSQAKLVARKANADKLFVAWQTKFEKGDASLLDLNRIKMAVTRLQASLVENSGKINTLNQRLTEMNGGVEIALSDTLYPISAALLPIAELHPLAMKSDYTLLNIQQEQIISSKQEALQKAMALPKLEAGYRHQSILGQQFNGFHAGISVPLFENKHKAKAAQQETLYFEALETEHKNHHHNEIEALNTKALNLEAMLEEYRQLFAQMNNEFLLAKALELGEISSIEYFQETQYFYDITDEFLQLEWEYHTTVATLQRYAL